MPKKGLPDLEDLFRAGDYDHTVGNLQEILRAAWRVMTPAQGRALFAEPALASVLEYEPLIGHLIPRC